LTCSFLASAWKESSVGGSIRHARFSIPNSRWMASLNTRTAASAHFAAPGWALNTTELPAATMLMMLHATVGIECVDGVTAPITPNGAHSSSVIP